MGLITILRTVLGLKPSSSWPLIGNTEPLCPYCEIELDIMPGRKKKCPSCGEFIYVRTRPHDRKRILIKEDQISVIEEQWAIENGAHNQYLAKLQVYNEEKETLRHRFGKEPCETDIQWSLLNKSLIEHGQNLQMGLYRNDRLAMGDLLKKASKELAALETYFEVCYIDLNGPNNCSPSLNPKMLSMFPPCNPENSFLAGGVVKYIRKLLVSNNITLEEGRKIFIKVATSTKDSLKLPVKVNQAWEILEKELD